MRRIIIIVAMLFTGAVHVYTEDSSAVKELFIAIEKSDTMKVRMLLTDPNLANLPNEKGMPPLAFATMKGKELIAEELLNRGADINGCDRNGITPLMWAASKGNEKLVKMFVIRGALINQKDKSDGKTALQWAYLKNNPKIIKFLKDAGASDDITY